MPSVNKVILIGHLGRDPEQKYLSSGTAVANFSIATAEKGKDAEGNATERTEWHQIVAWAKTAELCSQYLKKGDPVYIEGSLRTREWEDKKGAKRRTTEVVAYSVQFLRGKAAPDSGGDHDDDIPF